MFKVSLTYSALKNLSHIFYQRLAFIYIAANFAAHFNFAASCANFKLLKFAIHFQPFSVN